MRSESQRPPGGDIDSPLRRPSPDRLPPLGAHQRPLFSAPSSEARPPVFKNKSLLVTAVCVAAGCAVGGLLCGVSFDTNTSANREKGLPEGGHNGGDHKLPAFIPVPRLPEPPFWDSSVLLSTSSREGLPSFADEARLPSADDGGGSTVGALPTGGATRGIGIDRRPARAGKRVEYQPRRGARGGSKAQHVLVELDMLLSSDDSGVAADPRRGVESGGRDLPRAAAGKDVDADADMTVDMEEARGDHSEYRYHGLYHRAAAAEEGGGGVPTIVFESDEASQGDRTPRSVPRGTTSGSVGDGNGAAIGEDDMCSPLEVVGLDACPDLAGTAVEKMLAAKADMLRQVIEVLTDPTSAGTGGKRDEPLLLVKKLAVDETDAVFGAFEPAFNGHTTDATGWSPLPGGFNRWVERYHRDVLKQTRPVLITVHGDDVCALEMELSREARAPPADTDQLFSDNNTQKSTRRMPGEGEDFEVPVVLMTLGWDPAGDPTHREDALGRDRACVFRVLEMPRVKRWFTSHTRYDSHTDELFRYLPIGFGGHETRNGLPHTSYIAAAQKQLEILETCPTGKSGRYDLLFQCNSLYRDPRTAIWQEMTQKESGPMPVNRAPLDAADMVTATAKGIFGVSPPGTGPDCFRHYEMMLEGIVTLVPDVHSMRRFMQGLPAFFFGKTEAWGSLTCERLLEMAESVQSTIRDGKESGGERGFQYKKLTHDFWRRYIRRETLLAGGVTDENAPYTERSVVPLNDPGWETFRHVGCFVRKMEFSRRSSAGGRKYLASGDRTPENCATYCSRYNGGGIGFFSLSEGKRCWCHEVPGEIAPPRECDAVCDGEEESGGRCGGKARATVYVFGPEERGAPFEYLGCFPETRNLLVHAEIRFRKSNTPFLCEALCTSLRYPFFALEKSAWCRCGVMPANTPRSVRVPAFVPGGGYIPDPGPPNAALAAKAIPDGVRVGDVRFECRSGRCSGNASMWGCGGDRAYDLYRNTDPCVLYRECED